MSLHNRVAAELRAMMADGRLLPGARIPERQLCKLLDVSRTPFREALRMLAAEGLVELLPNRGARIAKLTRADAEYVFEVMETLEASAGELACRRMSEADVARIRALHYEMEYYYKVGELGAYFERNRQIHEAIVAAAQNPVLSHVYHTLNTRIQRLRYMTQMSQQQWAQAMRDHAAILRNLEQRDGEALSRVLREHLNDKFQQMVNSDFAMTDEPATATASAQGQ